MNQTAVIPLISQRLLHSTHAGHSTAPRGQVALQQSWHADKKTCHADKNLAGCQKCGPHCPNYVTLSKLGHSVKTRASCQEINKLTEVGGLVTPRSSLAQDLRASGCGGGCASSCGASGSREEGPSFNLPVPGGPFLSRGRSRRRCAVFRLYLLYKVREGKRRVWGPARGVGRALWLIGPMDYISTWRVSRT